MREPPTLERYQRAVDQMLSEFHELSQIEVRGRTQRVGRIVYGWVAHVHELAISVKELASTGRGHASLYLTRAMLEHTVMAHWVRLTGDRGVDAILARHQQSSQTLQEDARGGRFELSQEFIDSLMQHKVPSVTESTIARRFEKVCADLGMKNEIYASYRMASQFLHPGFLVASLYAQPDGDAMLQRSALDDHGGDIAMAAHCLVWSGRTLDELMPGKPRKKGLQAIARELQFRPILPLRTSGVIKL